MNLIMKYFVLKPKAKSISDVFAKASQEAMLAYAKIIERDHNEFANELISWALKERERQEGM